MQGLTHGRDQASIRARLFGLKRVEWSNERSTHQGFAQDKHEKAAIVTSRLQPLGDRGIEQNNL